MDERKERCLGLLAALVVPTLCGMVVARLMVVRPGMPPRMSTEVVFVMAPPSPVATVRARGAGSAAAIHAGSRSVGAGREPLSAVVSPVAAGGGGAESGAGGLDLSLPDTGLQFGNTTVPAGDDWAPSLPRMRVRMVDSSFGGRLARMQKGALCNELKLMASGMSAGSAPDRESLMKEMAELGCLR